MSRSTSVLRMVFPRGASSISTSSSPYRNHTLNSASLSSARQRSSRSKRRFVSLWHERVIGPPPPPRGDEVSPQEAGLLLAGWRRPWTGGRPFTLPRLGGRWRTTVERASRAPVPSVQRLGADLVARAWARVLGLTAIRADPKGA